MYFRRFLPACFSQPTTADYLALPTDLNGCEKHAGRNLRKYMASGVPILNHGVKRDEPNVVSSSIGNGFRFNLMFGVRTLDGFQNKNEYVIFAERAYQNIKIVKTI